VLAQPYDTCRTITNTHDTLESRTGRAPGVERWARARVPAAELLTSAPAVIRNTRNQRTA